MGPSAAGTDRGDERFDEGHLGTREDDWVELQQRLLPFPAMLLVTQHRLTILVVLSIDGFARVTVKARSVSSPRNVKSEEMHDENRVEDDPTPLIPPRGAGVSSPRSLSTAPA